MVVDVVTVVFLFLVVVAVIGTVSVGDGETARR